MQVFISHSSANAPLAKRVETVLAASGIDAWLDSSDIRVGTLLRDELQQAITASKAVVLLWSKRASMSRWVAAELLMAYHLNRFVVPCVIDATPLPFFLDNTLNLPISARTAKWVEPLVRALNKAPKSRNRVPAVLRSESPQLADAIAAAAEGQGKVLDALGRRDLASATQMQGVVDHLLQAMRKAWPLEPMVLNLSGYNEKNRYTIRHWAAIQAGRPPKNKLLEKAERFFFDALFGNPDDTSALNGLGSILTYSRDFDAARFFIKRAIALARRAGLSYEEAKSDLKLIALAR